MIAPTAAAVASTAAGEDQCRDLCKALGALAGQRALLAGVLLGALHGKPRTRAEHAFDLAPALRRRYASGEQDVVGAWLLAFPGTRVVGGCDDDGTGAQPMFVEIAASRKLDGRGAGSVKISPMRR
jgi:hypothetical protein